MYRSSAKALSEGKQGSTPFRRLYEMICPWAHAAAWSQLTRLGPARAAKAEEPCPPEQVNGSGLPLPLRGEANSTAELLERVRSLLKAGLMWQLCFSRSVKGVAWGCDQDEHLRLRDLPETRSSDFSKALQELGFSSALERVKIAKAVNAIRESDTGASASSTCNGQKASAERDTNQDWDTGKFDTWQYEEMSKVQKAEAKFMVKDFVKAMVHGRRLQMLKVESGEIVDAQVSLNKRVDRLIVHVAEEPCPVTTELCEILDVVPVDEPNLSVLVKTGRSEKCFLLPTAEERDVFTNALGILSQVAQRPK